MYYLLVLYVTPFVLYNHGSLVEDGGKILKFEGLDKRCTWKTAIRVHNPKFYWKVSMFNNNFHVKLYINGIYDANAHP